SGPDGSAAQDTTPAEPSAPAGPSAEDVAAAAQMSAGDRAEMIRGMVARLEGDLIENGGTPERWAQLFKALGVLGETDRARAAWQAAEKDLAGDAAGLARVRAAAEAAGALR
ncbi:MAG: c-type cytochrome biogenesis protein CcmI, partial [Alphaproteobacteria bacterium]